MKGYILYYKKITILLGIFIVLLVSILLFFLYSNISVFAQGTSCSYPNSSNSPIYAGQSSILLTPKGDGNSYKVTVSNSSPYYVTTYTGTCTTTYAQQCVSGYYYYLNGYPQYVCTNYYTPPATTSPSSYQTTTYVNGGPVTLYENSNNPGYLSGLTDTSISCPGSFSNTVSVNNGAVLSHDNGTTGSALSGVNISAYTSSGNNCNGGSAGPVNPDLRDSTVTMTLHQTYQDVSPGGSTGAILTYYTTPSCNGGGWIECQNTNVLNQFTEKPQYKSDQSKWLIPNPPSTVTYNCSMESQSPNTTITINNSVLKTLQQGSNDAGIDKANIGYKLVNNCYSKYQVVMSGSPQLHHPDTDTQPFNLILTANTSLPFNTEQHGGNPDGAVIYTVSTNCNNQNNFGECQNNNKDGYWKITPQSTNNWLYLYDGKSISKLSAIYVYCLNSTGPTSDQLNTTTENGSAYIGYNCYTNPKNLKFWIKAYTNGKGLGAKISHIGTLNLSNPGNKNVIYNPSVYTDKLNIYAPWMQISNGNTYSRGGYNVTIPNNSDFASGLLEWATGIVNLENGSHTNVTYQGNVGITRGSNLSPVYDFNFFATLYCEIHGCSQANVYSNGLINPQAIPSNTPSFSSIPSMATNPSSGKNNWFYINTGSNCDGTYNIGPTSYSGSAVVLVCGNVTITPNLYPQDSSCPNAGSNPQFSVQNCPGLVIISSGSITINSTVPSTQFYDNDLDANTNSDATTQEGPGENGTGISTLSSGYDIVDAFLVSMGRIILNN
ncbi:hypothetical protein M1145_00380 [Patescibacteria group bacterium]|nr:hypothetical protein [Patescibacteria group bacterium]